VTPISNIICEHPLPLDKVLSEQEDEDFEGIEWDEFAFDTFSFFNENEFQTSSYLISEDGLFYEHVFNIELDRSENDELVPKEVDAGLTRQDFTGEIIFGTEIFGKDYDYEIIFKTLFFKGDLKELELDHFSKRENSKRREAAKKIQREVQLYQRKKRNPIYLFVSAFKFTVGSLIEIPKWILFKTFAVVLKLELWSKTK
tara:strand:- start:382 stop:981 length:600 start_codon:yes stop_codon:yes gene_type:complete